ncbi:hypothetical protein OQA88_10980 [Cercophora sp. LCS_1]
MLLLITALTIVLYALLTIPSYLRLRRFPGPPLAQISHLYLFLVALSSRAYKIHMRTRRLYGPGLIRIAPDTLITDDPTIIRRINAPHSGYTKGPWYSVMRLDPYRHTMVSSPDAAFHDDIKARVAPGYSGREVPSMEGDVDSVLMELKGLMERKYVDDGESGLRVMDWGVVAQWFTLDVLTRVVYGREFGYLAREEDVFGYVGAMEDMGIFFALCSDVPALGRILLSRPVLRLLGPKVGDKRGFGVLMRMAKEVVAERFEQGKLDKPDMLGSFIRRGLPQRQCEVELLAQLVAGSDTTANVFRVALHLAISTPRVYNRLQQEIDDAVAAGQISRPVTAAEGKKLAYLRAFLDECLRFTPPVSLLFPRVVPPKGDTLDGKFVPGGTNIATDFWSMGRRVDIFGEDACVFRPERFLEASPEKKSRMEKTTDMFFGNGRYMCTGKTLAWMEMNKLFIELLRDYDFQMIDPETPYTRSHRALFVIRNMKMRVARRNV